MPTYLVHGFRWPRAAIRVHIVVYDLEDAAAEWIVAPASALTLLNSFYTLYDFLPPSNTPISVNKNGLETHAASEAAPGIAQSDARGNNFNDWSIIKLLEQCDPDDESGSSQPYAYVADYIVPIALSVDIAAEIAAFDERQSIEEQPLRSSMGPVSDGQEEPTLSERVITQKSKQAGWLEQLRDRLAKGAEIGWYVVVVGDMGREVVDFEGETEGMEMDEESVETLRLKTPKSAGLRGFFRRGDKTPKDDA